MRHLRMELYRVQPARFVGHPSNGATLGRGHELEARWHVDHFIAMTHPDFEHAMPFRRDEVIDIFEQCGVSARADFGITKLTHLAVLYLAAQLCRHGLHAIANPQHRHTQIEHRLRRARCVTFRD